MNSYLEKIKDIILSSDRFSVEEKVALLSAITDADKQWTITDFKLDRTEKVKRTTAILLEQTIGELEEKRKAIEETNIALHKSFEVQEEKNHELSIEASLERVRTKAMAMQKPDDMLGVCRLISDELHKLNVNNIRYVQTVIFNQPDHEFVNYQYFEPYGTDAIETIDYEANEAVKEFALSMLSSNDAFYTKTFGEPDIQALIQHRKENHQLPDPLLDKASSLHFYFYSIESGALGMSTYAPVEEEILLVLKRFRNVFELAYRRYRDIAKAEEQAKEAQLELSLERVRARAMAMHQSDELAELVSIFFQELRRLEFPVTSCIIWINNPETSTEELWVANTEISKPSQAYFINPFHHSFFRSIIHAWKERDRKWIYELSGKEKEDFQAAFFKEVSILPDVLKKTLQEPEKVVFSASFSSFGALEIVGNERISDEKFDILHRFGKVFDLSFTRFIDLKKAEALAREGQIELGLERVRTRAMAMQRSEDLKEMIGTVFVELTKLDLELTRCIIMIFDPKTNGSKWWMANSEAPSEPMGFFVKNHDYPPHQAYVKAWKEKLLRFEYVLEGNNKKNWDDFLFVETELSQLPDFVISGMKAPDRVLLSGSFNNFGCLNVASLEKLSEEHFDILLRFAKVFDLTYTRFNDLKQAEAQAREAHIETALERVRSRTMAMQKSDELTDVAKLLFKEVKELGIEAWTTGFNVWSEDNNSYTDYLTDPQGEFMEPYIVYADQTALMREVIDARKSGMEFFVQYAEGEKLKEGYLALLKFGDQDQFEKILKDGFDFPSHQYDHFVFGSKLSLMFITYDPVPEAHDLFKRFGKVFEQTYTRFLDLKKAEMQARDAQIEVALERTRTSSMLMQHSEEIKNISGVFHEQLLGLGIPSEFSFVWLPDEPKGEHQFWATWAENENGMFNLKSKSVTYPLDKSERYTAECFRAWESGKPVHIYNVPPNEVASYFAIWDELIHGAEKLKAEFFPDGLYYAEAFMQYGCFGYIISRTLIGDEQEILRRFSVEFERAYTRFIDLQRSEAQARESQIQLAMERVRARTMAMQKSGELSEAASLLFKQIADLGTTPWSSGFDIWEEDGNAAMAWMANPDGSMGSPFLVPYTEDPFFKRIHHAGGPGNDFFVMESGGKELEDTYQYLFNLPSAKKHFDGVKALGFQMPAYQITHCAFFSHGYLMFITYEPVPEMWEIFKRFAKVFEQTYTRFLDLLKAEAQAKEAQIEAALERVRSRTMGMQKSDELKEVIQIVYEQFIHLNINIDHTGFVLDYKARDDYHIWIADKLQVPSEVTIPYFDCLYYNRFNEAKEKGEDFFAVNLGFEEKNRFYQKLLEIIPDVPEESKEFLFNCTGLAASTVLLDNVCLYIENFSGIPYSDEENATLMRFGNVFQQTYTRFLDLQKSEAQTRESQIQLALERVRARTMAMQRSEELANVATVLFQQVKSLGVSQWLCGFSIWEIGDTEFTWYPGSPDGEILPPCKIPLTEHPVFISFDESRRRGDELFVYEKQGQFQVDHYQYMLSLPGLGNLLQNMLDQGLTFPSFQIDHLANFSHGNLAFITYEHFPEMHDIFKRFAKVFEQTYTRFLDLQKAEAQAREAQIEASLERIRSRAMAMQKTEELLDAADLVGKELSGLGINSMNVSYAFMDENEKNASYYSVNPLDGKILPFAFAFPHTETEVMLSILSSWKKQEPFNVLELDEASTLKHQTWAGNYIKYIFELKGMPFSMEEFLKISPRKAVIYTFNFANGYLFNIGSVRFTAAQEDVVLRITKVFDLTYRRFLDLKQAESQAREAKIEAALERVRSRTMAMQKSSELTVVAGLLFTQVKEMGIKTWTTGFNVWNEDNNSYVDYITSPTGEYIEPYTVDTKSAEALMELGEARKSGKEFVVLYVGGEKIVELYKALMAAAHLQFEKMLEDGIRFPSEQYEHFVFGGKVSLMFITYEPVPEAHDIFRRFGKVFEQTYTRFLDLKTAEAQAREAKIEGALERVRSRTMGMQHSYELQDAALLMFQQVQELGVHQWACGYNIWEEDKKSCTAWMSAEGTIQAPFKTPSSENVFLHFYEAALRGEELFIEEIKGEECVAHYRFLSSLPVAGDVMKGWEAAGISHPSQQIFHIAYFKQGYLMFITYGPVPEAYDIFKRFAKVFEQTYTRFLDLQKAEAQALETIKRASVDRVRAEIASMRTTNDLEKITPLIWNELTTLGVPFIRCGVFIMDEEAQEVNTYLSNPEGEAIAAFHQPYNTPGEISEIIKSWRKKELHILHWDETKFIAFTNDLVKQGAVTSGEKYLTENRPTDLYLHFLPFLQGMLYAGNTKPLSDDALQLVQNLADAFSTAYARYEDFNKLEAAKEQVDKALTDLKQTQTQLVQAEKMASLGELTAGIAHEIQNPLNFVNNFSEVNAELSDEIMQAAINGNIEEIKLLAADIKSNQEKIREHGKRADSIVKGMLQHSRTSSGEKIPVDINVLADEYLRLAYHGVRAKDKSFNAALTTDFDPSIGKINIIPQEIGRVLLNLINNAFYAVAEKMKATDNGYGPVVTVSSKKVIDRVEISVTDNGNGIPAKVLDKIFQPFFTTKPTGQGTGLGLSLSYDIVKAHDGELAVTSEEGKGACFTINLPVNHAS